MIKELNDTLLGNIPENDIFIISYQYAEEDYQNLTAFMENEYDPDIILDRLTKERKRLQKLKCLKEIVIYSDRKFSLNNEERLRRKEILRAEERLFRFALMRDQGVSPKTDISIKEFKRWADILLPENSDKSKILLSSSEEFISSAKSIIGSDDESLIWLYSYIHEFIEVCPKKYLESGIFGKFMRSVLGVIFFSKSAENPDYNNILRLSGFFAATYLFDDILDDAEYRKEEKEEYFQNVLNILNAGNFGEIEYSADPLMKFSESAFTGICSILDEKRSRMVAQSYIAIARATAAGSNWNYSTPLKDKELYSVAAVKAAYTRVIPAILGGYTVDEKFMSHCMRGGLIFQLTDDLRDITDDMEEGNITPFNYFCYGAVKQNIHPFEIFLAAVSRVSAENLKDIPDAKDLWIMRITHSIRLLKLKSGEDDLRELLTEMNFPEGKIRDEISMIAGCSDVIIDIEAETAKIYSDIAVNLRGGWSKNPVFGH
ncbi:class 1 isoprenoid biosynthesis enzyme [Methanoplanus limicola]|uniref:Polyprenyl synthetase n=1 Tax=Methanoplanus limicola DSM 2279 TaxID=937775 RepID=H1YX78_9EURY|nr:class 1 isoprenoid biosynthesis enzyme [Methanoplanus limicola]EHQ35881.1 hypothetical protein Metlim_1780 [Methanoplanus limicola DSM 2279]